MESTHPTFDAALRSLDFRPRDAADLLSPYLSGESAFEALKYAVEELTSTARKDCDVLVQAFDLTVLKVGYAKPHTLLFRGLDHEGNGAFVVCHFSQLLARVVYLPKAGSKRRITGFANA